MPIAKGYIQQKFRPSILKSSLDIYILSIIVDSLQTVTIYIISKTCIK